MVKWQENGTRLRKKERKKRDPPVSFLESPRTKPLVKARMAPPSNEGTGLKRGSLFHAPKSRPSTGAPATFFEPTNEFHPPCFPPAEFRAPSDAMLHACPLTKRRSCIYIYIFIYTHTHIYKHTASTLSPLPSCTPSVSHLRETRGIEARYNADNGRALHATRFANDTRYDRESM